MEIRWQEIATKLALWALVAAAVGLWIITIRQTDPTGAAKNLPSESASASPTASSTKPATSASPRPSTDSNPSWTIWGDSLVSAGAGNTTIASELAALVGASVTGHGIASAAPANMTALMSISPAQVEFAGGEIPAALGPARVTIAPQLVSKTFPTIHGSIAGIAGTLQYSKGDYSFNRDSAGEAVPANSALEFQADISADFGIGSVAYWPGRDVAVKVPAMLTAATAMQKQHATTGYKFVVLSLLNFSREGEGSSTYRIVKSANAALKKAFGGNYIEVRACLIADGLAIEKLPATSADQAAIDSDALPPSLLANRVHLNANGLHAAAVCIYRGLHQLDPATYPQVL